jgi:ABC-type multidrug transport system fused ATPase/permease subunit
LAALALIALIGAYICYHITFKRKHEGPDDPFRGFDMEGFEPFTPKIHSMIRKLLPIPYEDVYIKSRDRLKLHARYYHKVDGAPIIIKVHGYNGCPLRDFCGGGVEHLDKVYNVLLIDQRAHEYSEGKSTTFGIKEKYDVCDWAKYLVKRFGKDTKIVIYGISMGAATVLMTDPVVFLMLLTLFIIMVAIWRYISLASITCIGLYPLILSFMSKLIGYPLNPLCLIFSILMAALIIGKHWQNVQRLRTGTESKFSFKKSVKSPSDESEKNIKEGEEK